VIARGKKREGTKKHRNQKLQQNVKIRIRLTGKFSKSAGEWGNDNSGGGGGRFQARTQIDSELKGAGFFRENPNQQQQHAFRIY